VTRCGGVTTLGGGEATPCRKKVGDDVSWADTNITWPKNKEIHMVD
jgi:hypothetical protein